MKKLLCLPLLCGLAFGANFKVSARYVQDSRSSYAKVTIIALADAKISNVVFNRGNCNYNFKDYLKGYALGKALRGETMPDESAITLAYGKHLELSVGECQILEVQITSDKGKETYNF